VQRGLRLEINLDNLTFNLKQVKKRVKRPIIAVVKADAYGHGAIEVAHTLTDAGADILAVAFLSEALHIKDAGINSPILVLFDNELSEDILRHNLIPMINSLQYAVELSRFASKANKVIEAHLNIDTGMGRMGINSDTLLTDIDRILKLPGLRITGIMTHFPDVDSVDKDSSLFQIKELLKVKEFMKSRGMNPLAHAANSDAILKLPESYLDAVRPGLLLYGALKTPMLDTKGVMTVKTFVAEIRRLKKGESISYGRTFITQRDSIVGVLPVGYADGLPRAISNNFEVLIRGQRAPIVGRVCMDLTMVDLTDLPEVKTNDEVILIGTQNGETITAEDMASSAGTISYEILTSVGRSPIKRYISKNRK
jgi:alanine racemase